MAPLILHNVPDDELYVGNDGVQRPYAMIFSQQEGSHTNSRGRHAVPETGSFGRSTRRSRSKTATPARREDPTILSADKVFGAWIQKQGDAGPPRKTSSSLSQSTLIDEPSNSTPSSREALREPTEVILRGFRLPEQQYAAISHYEQLAGRICEDYPRDPPIENRRYKSELRDPALMRRQPLTQEERAKVNRIDSGNHWVKVTFESAQAAESAIFASPQSMLGCLIYAEPYHGIPPSRDEPVMDSTTVPLGDELPRAWRRSGAGGNRTAAELRQSFAPGSRLPQPAVARDEDEAAFSPTRSQSSSRTVDTGTASSHTIAFPDLDHPWPSARTRPAWMDDHEQRAGAGPVTTTKTSTAVAAAIPVEENLYCRHIPSARRATILPAEQALMPQPSYAARLMSRVPFVRWFSGAMIGSEVPRNEAGQFDWDKASLYWKVMCWLDMMFRLFGGDVAATDKED